jgi:acetyl esterase/lipase
MTNQYSPEWLEASCWTNARFLPPGSRPRAAALNFHGLGGGIHSPDASPLEIALAARGILSIYPHYGPWSWMNREARAFVDAVVAGVWKKFALPETVPLFSTGGSMGGCSALLYARYGKRAPAAVVVIASVCDTEFHYRERPDTPTSFHHAYGHYPEPFEQCLREHSPLAQAADMPDVPYLFVHGDADIRVSKARHSDKMVAALRAQGRRVEYMEVPGMGHGVNEPLFVALRHLEFLSAQF